MKASSTQEAVKMNQASIGGYIAHKRREQNLTQKVYHDEKRK